MNRMALWFAAPILALVLTAAEAGTLSCRVVVLDPSRTQHKIRVAGIDAPELKQAFGTRSRQSLAGMVFGKDVLVEWNKLDRYGRTVGVVLVNARDVNLVLRIINFETFLVSVVMLQN